MRVDFDIDDVAGFACAKQGALEGFGNQVHIEFMRAHFADGEAATIQADKAFGEDIGFERFGQGKPKRAVVCAFIDAGDGGGGDDVAAHQVAADFVAEAGGTLEVDFVARLQGAEVGFGQRFGHQVESHFAPVDAGDGEAAAVVGNRCADLQLMRHGFGQFNDVGAEIGRGGMHGADAADALYDAGKHGASLMGKKRVIVAFLRQAFRRPVRPDAV